ncbi:MAG: pilus assembly FimT family protein [Verrucomicrobiota bacterium]
MRRRAHRAGGFTLIEILLVIALMVLGASLLLFGVDDLTRGLGKPRLEDLMRQAVQEARYQALSSKQPAQLSWDAEAAAFVISGVGEPVRVASERAPDVLTVRLFRRLPREGIQARLAGAQQTEAERILFSPYGVAEPFEIEIDEGGETLRLAFDPFSNLVIDDNKEER